MNPLSTSTLMRCLSSYYNSPLLAVYYYIILDSIFYSLFHLLSMITPRAATPTFGNGHFPMGIQRPEQLRRVRVGGMRGLNCRVNSPFQQSHLLNSLHASTHSPLLKPS